MSEPDGLPPHDLYLTMMARTINETQTSLSITVFSHGSIITGTLISIEQFNREFGASLQPYATLTSTAPEYPHILHLRDVHINAVPVGWLRMRISAVDGFTL
jgi:hypothetical protein